MDPASVKVGFFKRCDSAKGGINVPLLNLLEGIRDGRWRKPVEALRGLPHNSAEYGKAKRHLPCILLSATTHNGLRGIDGIGEHSGLVQLDVDKVGRGQAIALRERFASDPHVLATWLSPGGEGVKAAVCVDASKEAHDQSFETVQEHFRLEYGVEIDAQCKDITRLCFVSHDPDLRLKTEAIPLSLTESAESDKFSPRPPSTPIPSLSSTSLPSAIYHLHNTPSLWEEYPKLEPYYKRNVLRFWSDPQMGFRYEAIQGITAALFPILDPKMVMECIRAYRTQHQAVFSDYPLQQALREAESILKGCEASYPVKRLTTQEAAVYWSLPTDRERVAFRICHSLSLSTADDLMPPPLFFISTDELGVRLGTAGVIGARILKRLQQSGAMEMVKSGTRRVKGLRGVATTFRWLLPSMEQQLD